MIEIKHRKSAIFDIDICCATGVGLRPQITAICSVYLCWAYCLAHLELITASIVLILLCPSVISMCQQCASASNTNPSAFVSYNGRVLRPPMLRIESCRCLAAKAGSVCVFSNPRTTLTKSGGTSGIPSLRLQITTLLAAVSHVSLNYHEEINRWVYVGDTVL